jgi:Rrf2 family protein
VAEHGRGPVSVRALAEQNRVPKRFLEHILLDLKSHGWVDSVPGKAGGYRLARSPDTITVGQIVRFFHGVLAPIGCVSVMQYEHCDQEAVCAFRHLFKQICDLSAAILDQATLAQVYTQRLVPPVTADGPTTAASRPRRERKRPVCAE